MEDADGSCVTQFQAVFLVGIISLWLYFYHIFNKFSHVIQWLGKCVVVLELELVAQFCAVFYYCKFVWL
jgi:hypothetical protein